MGRVVVKMLMSAELMLAKLRWRRDRPRIESRADIGQVMLV